MPKRNKSNTIKTWKSFLNDKKSVEALKKSWSAKNPQKHYEKTLAKLHRKFSSVKKKRKS